MKTRILLLILVAAFVFGCQKKQPQPTTQNDNETAQNNSKEVDGNQNPDSMELQADKANKDENKAGQLGQPAGSLAGVEWIKGEPVDFKDGLIYIVEFWATWCPPCRTSIPHLTEIQHKYKDQGVTIIGISNETDKDKVKDFVDGLDTKMDYTVALDPQRTVSNNYMKAFGVNGIPHAFIVDGKGKIVWHGHPMANMEEVLKQVLEGTFDLKAHAEKLELEKQINQWLNEYFTAAMKGDKSEDTRKTAQNLIDKAPPEALNELSWNIMTRVPENNRDMEIALQAAVKANTLSEGKNPMILDTYALALYMNNQLDEAIIQQQKAVEFSVDNEQLQKQLMQQLEKYKSEQ